MADFRTVAMALHPYISDTYDLLNATDAVITALEPAPVDPWADPTYQAQWEPDEPPF